MATRFELLETDEGTPAIRQGDASWRQGGTQKDNPYSMGSREHKEWAEGYALAWHKAADEQAAEADSRKRASELSHAQKLARVEQEKAEATAHRMRLAGESTEKRRARAKSRHKGLGARNRVNDKLYGIKYTPTVADAVSEAISICEGEGFVVLGEHHTDQEVRGSIRRVYSVEDEEGKEYGLTIMTYKMPSGTKYEITRYLSSTRSKITLFARRMRSWRFWAS